MARCIITVVCAMVLLVGLTGAAEISAARPGESVSAKCAFTSGEKGKYSFDTGILRGQFLQAGKVARFVIARACSFWPPARWGVWHRQLLPRFHEKS